MSLVVYATIDDLGAWFSAAAKSVPDNPDGLLRSAVFVIAKACNRDPYSDAPTPDEAAPLSDATCAQVEAWATLGIDPANAGTDMPGPVKSSKILDAEITTDTTAAVKLIEDYANGLCPQSQAILLQAGLLYVPGPQFDPCGVLPQWGLDVDWWDYGYRRPALSEWPL